MNVNDMRLHIINEYNSESWKNRVNHMGDNQVIAIYYNIQKRKAAGKKEKTGIIESDNYRQMDIYDYNREIEHRR